MKLLYTLLFTFAFTGTYTAAAQTTTAPSNLTKADSAMIAAYNNLKELFIKKIHSPSYKEYKAAMVAYKKKWRPYYDGTGQELADDLGGLKWLKDNWQKTEFESYEDAESEFKHVWALHGAAQNDNKEFYNELKRVNLKFGTQLYIDLYEEMMMEYPDKV